MYLKLAISKHKKGVNRYGWDIFMLVAKILVRQTTCKKWKRKFKLGNYIYSAVFLPLLGKFTYNWVNIRHVYNWIPLSFKFWGTFGHFFQNLLFLTFSTMF